MAEAVVGDDDYGEDPTVRGEPGVGAAAWGRRGDPRALSVVLAGEGARGAQGRRRRGVMPCGLAAQSGPSPDSLLEMQSLGPHTFTRRARVCVLSGLPGPLCAFRCRAADGMGVVSCEDGSGMPSEWHPRSPTQRMARQSSNPGLLSQTCSYCPAPTAFPHEDTQETGLEKKIWTPIT